MTSSPPSVTQHPNSTDSYDTDSQSVADCGHGEHGHPTLRYDGTIRVDADAMSKSSEKNIMYKFHDVIVNYRSDVGTVDLLYITADMLACFTRKSRYEWFVVVKVHSK